MNNPGTQICFLGCRGKSQVLQKLSLLPHFLAGPVEVVVKDGPSFQNDEVVNISVGLWSGDAIPDWPLLSESETEFVALR